MSDYNFGTFLGALFFIVLIIAITWVALRIQDWAIRVTIGHPGRQRVAAVLTLTLAAVFLAFSAWFIVSVVNP